jgi:hypothetical protein
MDLRDQLASIAGPAVAPTAADADADLARGRRALRRRRTVQTLGGSAFATAAVVAAFVFATGLGTGAPGPAATDSGTAVSTTQLVSYKGKQPKGFVLDKIPDGWFVQADDPGSIVLAPSRIRNQPSVDPSTDPLYDPNSFEGKIAVMLQSRDQGAPPAGTTVKVGDRDGVLAKSLDNNSGRTLWVEQPSGVYLQIQFWADIGLSHEQMVDFGAGVHVTKAAKQGAG